MEDATECVQSWARRAQALHRWPRHGEQKAASLHKNAREGAARLVFSRVGGMAFIGVVACDAIKRDIRPMAILLPHRLRTCGTVGGVPSAGVFVPLLML